MPDFDNSERFLLSSFQNFYRKLEELKTMAKSGTWIYKDEDKKRTDVKESDSMVSSSHVYQQLVSLFEEQQMFAGRKGGEMGSKLYNEALFVMSAISDEIFLTMHWAGQEAWSKFLLETKFFSSNAGGDIFFQRLDALLKERDPVYAELATLFLLALSLGFRGKYHGINDAGAIDKYKSQLYSFVFQQAPDLNTEDKKLFSNAYMHTLQQDSKTIIPGLKKWYGMVALLALSLLGISHIIWMQMTGDIAKIAAQILSN